MTGTPHFFQPVYLGFYNVTLVRSLPTFDLGWCSTRWLKFGLQSPHRTQSPWQWQSISPRLWHHFKEKKKMRRRRKMMWTVGGRARGGGGGQVYKSSAASPLMPQHSASARGRPSSSQFHHWKRRRGGGGASRVRSRCSQQVPTSERKLRHSGGGRWRVCEKNTHSFERDQSSANRWALNFNFTVQSSFHFNQTCWWKMKDFFIFLTIWVHWNLFRFKQFKLQPNNL